jgi:hypothetical protein
LPQSPDLEAQRLLSAGRQAVFPASVAAFHFAFVLAYKAIGQQAIQAGVKRARPKLVLTSGLPFDRLHDSVAMEVGFGQREKNVKSGGGERPVVDFHIVV